MCALVTRIIMRLFGADKYTDGEFLLIEDYVEEVRDMWVDKMFGIDSKIPATQFIKKCATDDFNFVFDPNTLRKALLEGAKLNNKY